MLIKVKIAVLSVFFVFVLQLSQPCLAGWDPIETDQKSSITKRKQSRDVIARFIKANPKLAVYFNKARGYALFPDVIKGGIGLGGSIGNGILYERRKAIGTVSLKQMTVGLQLGAQSFSEIIFFKDKETIDKFKKGGVKFNAQAMAAGDGDLGSAHLDYNAGIATFTLTNTGYMAEAAIGGQHFKFTPYGKK